MTVCTVDQENQGKIDPLISAKLGHLSNHQLLVLNWMSNNEMHIPQGVCVCVCVCGGGGYSHFFFIRRFEPSIYSSPQKVIRNFKHQKKIFEILATPNNFPHSVP